VLIVGEAIEAGIDFGLEVSGIDVAAEVQFLQRLSNDDVG
jgi:hypothetical protein